MAKRLFIFAHYDKDNIIDDYVIYYIKELLKVGDVIFVSDAELKDTEKDKINKIVIKIISENHGEYDFGSYKRGLKFIIYNNLLEKYDWLVMCNDSVYGPFYPLRPIFEKMESKNADVWGLTKNINKSYAPHIQSYFIAISKNTIKNKKIKLFFENVERKSSKKEIIKEYEIGFSKLLDNYGYKTESFLEEKNFPTYDIVNNICALKIIREDNFPFLKKRIIIENGAKFFKLCRYEEIINQNFCNYPVELISNNAIRLIGKEKFEENLNYSYLNFFVLKIRKSIKRCLLKIINKWKKTKVH
jgi:lipopolysaccharide biosynthesis protein